MDQQLNAVIAHHTNGVQAFGHLRNSAVKGSINGVAGGLHAAAGAQDRGGKGLVRQLLQRDHLAVNGKHDRHLLAGKFRLGCGLAAKKLVKKAHNTNHPSTVHKVQPLSS